MPPPTLPALLELPAGFPGQRYQPVLSGFLSVFYENAKLGISKTEQVTRFTSLGGSVVPVDWNNVLDMDYRLDDFEQDPPAGATYKELPAEAKLKTSFTAWQRACGSFGAIR